MVLLWFDCCIAIPSCESFLFANHSYLARSDRGLSRSIEVYRGLSRSIEAYRGLSRPIEVYPGLSRACPAPSGTKQHPVAPSSTQWHQAAPGLSLGYPDPVTSYPHPLILPLFHMEHSNTNSNANHSYYHLYSAYVYN